MLPTRRSALAAFLAAPVLSAQALRSAFSQAAPALPPTPGCGDEKPTPANDEGPFFKPDAPLRHDLSRDAPHGERITIAGYVLDATCRPVPGALLQIWHADEVGSYDNTGFRLRGHQFTDDGGRWWFSTVVPGLYPGRTRHYHFKVQRSGGAVLTTQLFFPGEPRNKSDWLFDKRLLLAMSKAADGKFGRFDFVV
jgi:protocatechuate 3,4-dioxygenase beta subunit